MPAVNRHIAGIDCREGTDDAAGGHFTLLDNLAVSFKGDDDGVEESGERHIGSDNGVGRDNACLIHPAGRLAIGIGVGGKCTENLACGDLTGLDHGFTVNKGNGEDLCLFSFFLLLGLCLFLCFCFGSDNENIGAEGDLIKGQAGHNAVA